jgi:EAL domain-containing protein (putative c-di-GMP-specific phosphodiesterase class I)
VHINVSARGLVTQPVLEAFPADLRAVVLEITEQDISSDMDVTVEIITELRDRGATLAIDDFGVGFSNLRRMIGLRPEVIKLDRSLISGVENDQGSRSVIAAMASQARLNEQKICAEGIETPAELETLLGLGVPHGQGYLFSPPVSVSELGVGLARAIRERSRARVADLNDVAEPLGSRRS